MAETPNVRRADLTQQRLQIIQAALGDNPIDISVVHHLMREQMRLMQIQADRIGRLQEDLHLVAGAVAESLTVLSALEAAVIEALKAEALSHES